jgi:hypothetical protein
VPADVIASMKEYLGGRDVARLLEAAYFAFGAQSATGLTLAWTYPTPALVAALFHKPPLLISPVVSALSSVTVSSISGRALPSMWPDKCPPSEEKSIHKALQKAALKRARIAKERTDVQPMPSGLRVALLDLEWALSFTATSSKEIEEAAVAVRSDIMERVRAIRDIISLRRNAEGTAWSTMKAPTQLVCVILQDLQVRTSFLVAPA